jgi:hypothetical protein
MHAATLSCTPIPYGATCLPSDPTLRTGFSMRA